MLKFAADENFNGRVVRGPLRVLPKSDLVRVQEAMPLSGASDPGDLERADEEGRQLHTRLDGNRAKRTVGGAVKAVCDTSPLCFLVLIGEAAILPALFDEVFIPQAVLAELRHPKAPEVVRRWISRPREWLKIRDVPPRDEPRLRVLHDGEREAILLFEDLGADWLIVDEMAARRVARSLNLRVTGLLGLLSKAAERNLLDLPQSIERLRKTHFRVDERLLEQILEQRT